MFFLDCRWRKLHERKKKTSQNSFLLLLLSTLNTFVYQELRKDWVAVLMIVTSARSSINIRHLEKATVSTGKEGLLSEGNAAYNWSRCSLALIWKCKLLFYLTV